MVSELRELGRKSTIVLMGNIFGYFFTFISVIIIGRLLGAETYGQFVYITSFLLFFTVIPKLGLENGIVAFLSRSTITLEQKRSILTFCLVIVGVLSFVVVILSYLNAEFIYQKLLNDVKYGELFLLLLPTVILESLKAILRSSLRAARKIKEITVMDNLINPVSMILFVVVLVVIFDVQNYYSLVIPFYINSIVGIIYYAIKLRNLNLAGKIIMEFDNKQIIRFSWPLLFTGILLVLTHNVDKYMIGYMMTATDVGIYKMAVQFGTISNIGLLSVNTIFAPLISSLYHDNRIADLGKLYSLTTKWITIFNLMIFGMIVVFSKDIMQLAGNEFIVGGTALILVALGQVLNSIVGSVAYMNSMTGNPKVNLVSACLAIIVNIVLNFLLIAPYGINGAAIATAASVVVRNIINFVYMYINLKMNPYDGSYLKLIGVLGIAVLSIFIIAGFIQTNYFIRLIICGVIYSGIFLLLTYRLVMSEYELKVLKSEISKRLKKA